MKTNKEVVLIGAGIMSATLAVLLKQLDPSVKIKIFEMLEFVADESSAAMNNAGTGHSGSVELNYTPMKQDGSIDIKKALEVGSDFLISKEFWAYLVQEGYLKNPKNFINSTSHYSFVNNQKDVDFLTKRYAALSNYPLFSKMEFTNDAEKIKEWLPLVMNGRNKTEPVAATKSTTGTDVDFQSLTKEIIKSLLDRGEIELHCKHMTKDIKKNKKTNKWEIKIQDLTTKKEIIEQADFTFIGAGGGALLLLEKSNIPEAKNFGGFPVGGQWLVCDNEEVVAQHAAKVYGKAKDGSPPMSVPHLDSRTIDGKKKLMFGPFATFSTKFLKNGSRLDFFNSLQVESLGFMTQAGYRNMDLTKYLLQQVRLTKEDKIRDLQQYLPNARIEDWHEQQAGLRVQVIKKDGEKGGVLQFGTEIVSSSSGDLAALLGASPGASTSVSIMVKVLSKCFGEAYKSNEWQNKLYSMIPSLNMDFSDKQKVYETESKIHKILNLNL